MPAPRSLSFRRDTCSVLREVHMFIAWPQSAMSCSLSEELVASRASRNCGYWCVFEEERSVKRWATFYLDLHYIMHTIYSSGLRMI